MVTIFEDIFKQQDNDLKLDKEVEAVEDEWATELASKKDDVWNTGQVNDVWSVG